MPNADLSQNIRIQKFAYIFIVCWGVAKLISICRKSYDLEMLVLLPPGINLIVQNWFGEELRINLHIRLIIFKQIYQLLLRFVFSLVSILQPPTLYGRLHERQKIFFLISSNYMKDNSWTTVSWRKRNKEMIQRTHVNRLVKISSLCTGLAY